ncbi:MAG: SprB repeat-containing protein, partial [Bacteroidota bacterium]|nr:SprB repeat-containing protein [Bacteroidota bacterium]
MKKLYFLLIFIAGGFSLSAQSISIDHYNLDQGNDVIVSIDMQNMVNMGAITIFVGYDNTVLQYDTILNINSQFPGLMANNMNNTQIGMVWSAFLSGVTITSAELCQLRFNFLGNSSDLSFNPGCEIADFNAITIVTTFVNGSVSETIVASINGLAAGYCEDQSNITLSGLPAGGIFTIDGVTGTSFQPNILGPGSYTVNYMVTNAYNFGDTATQIVQVYEVPLVFVQTQDVICFGQSTGEATAFVSQGSSPYFYNWSDGQTTATAQNLVAGNHNIQIIDNNGCEAFTSFNINQGIEIIADINITHLSSLGAGNGAIDVTVSGGNPPYSYVWSDTSTSEDISNLDHGLYGLTIVDALLCEQQAEALVRVHSSQQFSIPDQWSMFSFNI